ncbi:MAG: hypothetical protein E2O84_03265 [Bacteroidetes bacterium]|nr:MAG: hypothetical protein E2O84_03265 [Bacteroidota bacterium]
MNFSALAISIGLLLSPSESGDNTNKGDKDRGGVNRLEQSDVTRTNPTRTDPTNADPTGDELRVLRAHKTDRDIAIDGILDEEDWQTAPFASDFLQSEPVEGAEPSQRTEVRILYGNNSIYIGARLYDAEPDQIWQTLGRRDSFNKADWFTVSIDAYLNRKEAYTFGVNAAGVQLDGIISSREVNTSWNAVWESSVRVTNEGWIAEIRIPYSMLRFSAAEEQSWGINFKRIIPRTSETLQWALVRRTERQSGIVAHYGELQGLQQLQTRRNVQFTPYTVSRMLTQEGNPGQVVTNTEADFGADLKLGLSSNMTLDLTVNPDFGQVEADPAQLNLSAFETFNRERRPFFVEGARSFTFDTGMGSGLLYTRRIGSADPIVGATKLSGRTDGGLSFGILGAATGANFNPDRFYGSSRFRQELGLYSFIGGIFTFYNRDSPGSVLTSMSGGTDWDIRMSDNTYKFSGYASVTDRNFSDTPEFSSRGFAASGEIERIRGDLTYGLTVSGSDDEFNPNDVGRESENNKQRLSTRFSYQLNGGQPFGPFQRASGWFWTFHSRAWTDGLYRGSGFYLRSDLNTRGFQKIEISANADYLFGGYNIYETRGLLPWQAPRKMEASISVETDSRRLWTVEPKIEYEITDLGGNTLELKLKTDWDVTNRLGLSASVKFKRENNVTAWASNETFSHDSGSWKIGEFSGNPSELSYGEYVPVQTATNLSSVFAGMNPYEGTDEYYVSVFGERDTEVVDFTLRGNITFSPNLSLQVYGQLFTAKGYYEDFSILANPDTLVPVDNYAKRREFSTTSFQTNTVLRWEYRPGSTLYIVWTHARVDSFKLDPLDNVTASGFQDGTLSQIGNAFSVFPDNVFLVKLNYTFLR